MIFIEHCIIFIKKRFSALLYSTENLVTFIYLSFLVVHKSHQLMCQASFQYGITNKMLQRSESRLPLK